MHVDQVEPGEGRLGWQHLSLLIAVIVGGAIALALQDGWVADRYMTDDAFISFRYAHHLADGLGPVWSPGDRVEGYTNFGWVLALALAMKAGVGPIDASRALGIAASVGILATIPVLASEFRQRGSAEWWALTLGAIAALSANTGLSVWTFAGLETTAFAFFVTLGLTVYLRERRRGSGGAGSAVLLFIASLIRPDGVVIFAIAWLWRAVAVATRWDARAALRLVVWTGAFALPFGAYWLWRWSYYGDLFPNTYYLKTGSGRAFYERGAWYAWDFFSLYWIWLGAGVLASIWRERHAASHASLVGCTVIIGWFAYVIGGGGDWMPYFRFFVPVLALLYILILQGLIDLATYASGALTRRRLIHWGSLAVVSTLVVVSSLRPYDSARAKDPSGFDSDILPGSINVDVHRAIGVWFREHVPADATIAQIATGIVPYYSERKTIDMLGVNDHHIAHRDARVPNQPAGHDKEDGAYIVLSRPEVIWLSVGLEGAARRTPDDYRPPIDGRIAPVITEVSHNAYLWVFYRPVAVHLDGGWLNLLVRSDITLAGTDE